MLGCVTYSDEMKRRILGVNEKTLAKNTAVSDRVACEMALGMRKLSGADIGLSTTGYAGPDGGTPLDPVGTVYIGLSVPDGSYSTRCVFEGDRTNNNRKACERALTILLEWAEKRETE